MLYALGKCTLHEQWKIIAFKLNTVYKYYFVCTLGTPDKKKGPHIRCIVCYSGFTPWLNGKRPQPRISDIFPIKAEICSATSLANRRRCIVILFLSLRGVFEFHLDRLGLSSFRGNKHNHVLTLRISWIDVIDWANPLKNSGIIPKVEAINIFSRKWFDSGVFKVTIIYDICTEFSACYEFRLCIG